MADKTPIQDTRPLATPSEVSAYLGVPVQTLHTWRTKGTGPAASRIGKHLRYRWADVEEFVTAQQTA